jgi:predicted O-methyltransferase YrrM
MITRIKNKISKERRKLNRRGVPYQPLTTFRDPKNANWYEPLLAGPGTFADAATSAETIRAVSSVVASLTPEPFAEFTLQFYQAGLERFGASWRYADVLTVLHAVCRRLTPLTYLEIGVRRGRSMSVVASAQPEATLLGFDMWIQNYVGQENPGPAFVEAELAKVGFRGRVELISGNSHVTVADYFRRHPDVFVDVATVDGDHTARGAAADLRTVIPRLKIGGVLVFDDICNVEHTYLRNVWHDEVADSPRFSSWSFEELGHGVAFAIKKY